MLTTVLLAVCIGLVAPLLAPMLLKHTRWSTSVGNRYAEFVAKVLGRPGIGVDKQGDLNLRQLGTDAVYDKETITVDGQEKKITRLASNVHRLGRTPFAFVDEYLGVTFDLRDVAVGAKEREYRSDGTMVSTFSLIKDTGNGAELIRRDHFVRGFIELGKKREGLSLSLDESVRPIVDGGEKAHWWEHMWEAVKRMFEQEDVPLLKMLIPFGVLGASLFLGYYLLGPGKMPGGSTSSDPIDVGMLLLLSAPSVSIDRHTALQFLGVVATAVVAGGAFVLAPATTIAVGIGVGIGATVLPVLALLAGRLGKGENLADLFLWAGLQAFREPTLDLTKDGRYRFEEASELDLENPPKKMLAKTLVAFACDRTPEAFGRAGHTAADVVDYQRTDAMKGDGGQAADDLPRGYSPADALSRAGHQAFVPDDTDPDTTYVRTDKALGRFANAATGDSIDVAEMEARKEFADGAPEVTDGQIMKYSGIAAAAGFGFWVVVALVF